VKRLDTFASQAFAVCDHQIAHVYVNPPCDPAKVRDALAGLTGVALIFQRSDTGGHSLDHGRAGDLVALSKPNAWFAYPFWLSDEAAPDYARTWIFHRKPGYDHVSCFSIPKLAWPKGRAVKALTQKKLGFRTLFDVVPLNPGLVKEATGCKLPTPKIGLSSSAMGPCRAKHGATGHSRPSIARARRSGLDFRQLFCPVAPTNPNSDLPISGGYSRHSL